MTKKIPYLEPSTVAVKNKYTYQTKVLGGTGSHSFSTFNSRTAVSKRSSMNVIMCFESLQHVFEQSPSCSLFHYITRKRSCSICFTVFGSCSLLVGLTTILYYYLLIAVFKMRPASVSLLHGRRHQARQILGLVNSLGLPEKQQK